jgi:hypothetical protein
MRLELVGIGADVADFEDGLDVPLCEVGYADVSGEIGPDKVLQCPPRVHDARLLVELGPLPWDKGDWPVEETKIQIFESQVVESLMDLFPCLGRPVGTVPQLARHLDVLAGEISFGQPSACLILVP